jgi:glycosyltransferase involved in cell wall biosynthesis
MPKISKATQVFYFGISVIIVIFIFWYMRKRSFINSIWKAKPYITPSYIDIPSNKNTYTWMIHMYPPEHNAGAEMMAHTMNKYLIQEAGAKVNVILNKKDLELYERVNIIGRKDKKLVNTAIGESNILLSHLDNEPHAVSTAVETKKPLVLVMHNSFRTKYLKEFNKRLPNNLYLIHNSEWIKDYYKDLDLPSIVVYPPVSWRDFSLTSSREYVSLINMNKNKGGEIFLKIVDKMPDIKFLGVKGAYDEQMLEKKKNLILIDNTPQIKEVYSKTDILLMPSKYESWGRTAVEAMSAGIPVIAHPTPGLKESCGYAGIFCDRDDIDAWVREIRRLKTDEAYYKTKSEACLKRAKELDPEPQMEKMSEWLKTIQWKETE